MSLDPPTYLAQLQNNIRQRPIAWEGAVRTGTLTEDQLAKIRAVDKVKQDARKQTVEADLDGYRLLFVGEPGNPGVLELAARRQEIVQYVLVLLNDLLQSMSSFLPQPLLLGPFHFLHARILFYEATSSPASPV